MNNRDNKAFWQRFAALYEPFMKKSDSLYHDLVQCMSPSLRPDIEVLELACGTGQLSFPLASSVCRWEATDFSDSMIREAQSHPMPPQLHFSVQDATSLPYPKESFDAVVIANALHIMPEPEKALAEIHRVLKPDGLLFAPTFLWSTTFKGRLRLRLLGLAGFRIFHVWTEQELLDFLESQSFHVQEHLLLGEDALPMCHVIASPKL